MAHRHSLLDTITANMAPVHPDGHKFIAVALVLALAAFFFWPPLGWVLVGAGVYIAYFFRDPLRVTPVREGLVVAPADGRVSAIEVLVPPPELGLGPDPRQRISIFLSVFDVHINRAPVAGQVVRRIYVEGAFLNAELDKASEENERCALVIASPAGLEIAVVQIAGLIARRIVTFVGEGANLRAGERFGLIRFGSRVDTYLPPGRTGLVAIGQRAVAGETVLADLASSEPERAVQRG